MFFLICYSDKSSSDSSTVDHARPATAIQQSSSSTSVPAREERPNLITNARQPYQTGSNTTYPHITIPHNDVVDELDDDLDAAMMDVDLDMFDDNLVDEGQTGQREVKDEGSAIVPNVPMEMSLNRTSSLNTINDILAIVKERKFFHGTVRVKVCIKCAILCFQIDNSGKSV